MGWKQTEKPRTLLANKSLVKEFVEMDPAPYDRPLSERRLQVYERILRAGEFRTVTWASVVCHETNNTYRVNGKHTATLLSQLDPIPEFHVTVERYSADTLQDVANLYNTFDSTLASRTASDINAAFAATIPQFKHVPARLINMTVSAASFHQWDENELRKVPPAEKAELLLDNVDFVLWLGPILHPEKGEAAASVRPLLRSAIVAAMMATHRKAPRVAHDFWTKVRDETAPDREDASRVLARFLVRAVTGGAGNVRSTKDKKMVGFRELYVKCIHAWNAWRKEETTALRYIPEAPLPAVSK